MPVPEEIRKVERPVNTVVVDTGSSGDNRYAVRERKKSIHKSGCNPSPRNGKIIGHIVNGKYEEIKDNIKKISVTSLEYGTAAVVKSVIKDIKDDLHKCISLENTDTILAFSSLRVINREMTIVEAKREYDSSFISKYFPLASMSKDSLTSFIVDIGRNNTFREDFTSLRMKRVDSSHHIALDGTLKSYSGDNSLSSFSRKAQIKSLKDMSVLYAYDTDNDEVLCSEVFSGNTLDRKAYSIFIRDNKIESGLLIDDKGFPPEEIKENLKENPSLHYLTPLLRNDKRITNNAYLKEERGTFVPELENGNGEKVESITYIKRRLNDESFICTFRDSYKASVEEQEYLKARNSGKKDFDEEDYKKKKESFGTITLISDLDLDSKKAYDLYKRRWKIEVMFKHYKNDIGLKTERVHTVYGVIGTEFLNLISTIIEERVRKRFKRAGLFSPSFSFVGIMRCLGKAWRKSNTPEKVTSSDRFWQIGPVYIKTMLEKLNLSNGLSTPEEDKIVKEYWEIIDEKMKEKDKNDDV